MMKKRRKYKKVDKEDEKRRRRRRRGEVWYMFKRPITLSPYRKKDRLIELI